MKKTLFFAATAIVFASCGSNQQNADQANQQRIDSMSQAMARQHIVDSMNAGSAENAAAPGSTTVSEKHTHSSSYEHDHSNNNGAPGNNTAPAAPAPVTAAPASNPTPPPVVNNTPVQPSAADIAAQKKADRNKELKSAAEGALIGAGAGAIGGAVAGKNNKFKKQDAAIGGGVGAALGAGAGLLLEKRKLKKDSTQH